MTRGLNGARRELSRLARAPSSNLCTSCLRLTLTTTTPLRHASTAAAPSPAAATSPVPVPNSRTTPHTSTSTAPHQSFHIRAGVLISRPPLITRALHPFEQAFFLYQRRLNERTALPFSRYFYYAKDTPGDVDWKRKFAERQTAARDIGRYNAYRDEPWNDEVLVGAPYADPEHQTEMLIQDATTVEKEGADELEAAELEGLASRKKEVVVERPNPRETEADRKKDVRSLNRALARTLYLVVKGEKGWEFPAGMVEGQESLHRAAERLMVQAAGANMNTWMVGKHPVGHFVNKYEKSVTDEEKVERFGEKTFYMKVRILAGQANLEKNVFGLKDFKWLVKEELEQELAPEYYKGVKNMLVST